MKIKKTLFYLFSLTLISTGIFTVILFNVNPLEADFLTKGAFFASIFFIIMGIVTFIGYYVRLRRANHLLAISDLISAVRQASLLSLIIVGWLLLESLRIFNWWDALLLMISIGLLELFFQTRQTDVPSYVTPETEDE